MERVSFPPQIRPLITLINICPKKEEGMSKLSPQGNESRQQKKRR